MAYAFPSFDAGEGDQDDPPAALTFQFNAILAKLGHQLPTFAPCLGPLVAALDIRWSWHE
jgi:hypothetical protein